MQSLFKNEVKNDKQGCDHIESIGQQDANQEANRKSLLPKL